MENDYSCPTPTLPESAVGTPSFRGARPEGQRNIQESTFSISGMQFILNGFNLKIKLIVQKMRYKINLGKDFVGIRAFSQ